MSKYAPHHRSSNQPRATSSTVCQKCLGRGHFIYECKNTRPYVSRPSRTQMLENPKLLAKARPSVEVPEEFKNKAGLASKILEAREKERLKDEKGKGKEENSSKRQKRSDSDDSRSDSDSDSDSASSSSSSESDSDSDSSSSDSSRSRERDRKRRIPSRRSRSRSDSRSRSRSSSPSDGSVSPPGRR